MSRYGVTIPISGHVYIEVSAENEKAAIDNAMELVGNEDVEEWSAHRKLVDGNVIYADAPWEASAENLDDDNQALQKE